MKVLWILNTPLPEARCPLTGRPEVSNSTGSWVCALADALSSEKDLQLFTAAPSPLAGELRGLQGETMTHFVFPPDSNPWKEIRDRIEPDVIHIHGSEYKHSLDYVKACGAHHVVVSLQGLVSEYQKVYFGGIAEETLRKSISLRDRIRKDTVFTQQADMARRGEYEVELLRTVQHVIGRTSWDKAVSLGIHPQLHYHFCNEALRAPFYSGRWSYSSCVQHRIFVSQGHNPIKGVHQLLEALPLVLEQYPDTHVRISGPNVLRGNSLKDRMLRNGYACLLSDRIQRNHLDKAVQFIGAADAEKVKAELLSANVFALVSIIENSPNSLCEAQMLGVPCVASDVGGTADLIPNLSCGSLYPFEDPSLLAERILDTFRESPRFDNTEMRSVAAKRHDRNAIKQDLLMIYGEIQD